MLLPVGTVNMLIVCNLILWSQKFEEVYETNKSLTSRLLITVDIGGIYLGRLQFNINGSGNWKCALIAILLLCSQK